MKLLGVKRRTADSGEAGWLVSFECWPKRDPYEVFVPLAVADEDIVRKAIETAGDEFEALARAARKAP